eukprot:852104-Rhodomonas_salina.3
MRAIVRVRYRPSGCCFAVNLPRAKKNGGKRVSATHSRKNGRTSHARCLCEPAARPALRNAD